MTDYEARLESSTAMLESVQYLCDEYAHQHPSDEVIRQTYRTREMLLAQGVRQGLVAATEAATRLLLKQRPHGYRVST